MEVLYQLLKNYHWKKMRAGREGFFILLEETEEGKREGHRIARDFYHRDFFGLPLEFEKFWMDVEYDSDYDSI